VTATGVLIELNVSGTLAPEAVILLSGLTVAASGTDFLL
jgi:hypothetical protein